MSSVCLPRASSRRTDSSFSDSRTAREPFALTRRCRNTSIGRNEFPLVLRLAVRQISADLAAGEQNPSFEGGRASAGAHEADRLAARMGAARDTVGGVALDRLDAAVGQHVLDDADVLVEDDQVA